MNGHDETPENGFNGNISSPNPDILATQAGVANSTPTQPVAQQPTSAPAQKRYIKGYEHRTAARTNFATTLPSQQPVINSEGSMNDDITIGQSARKTLPAKKIAIIAGLFIVTFIIAAIFVIRYLSRPSVADLASSYASYLDYLKFGPRNNEGEAELALGNDDWFFNAMFLEDDYYGNPSGDSDFEEDEEDTDIITRAGYFAELRQKYQDFIQKVNDGRLTSIDKEYFTKLVKQYGIYLDLLIMYGDSRTFSNEILQKYIDNGIAGASELVVTIFSLGINNEEFRQLKDSLQQYGEIELKNFEIYKANDCLVDNTIDYLCDITIDDNSLEQNFERQNEIYEQMDVLYPQIKTVFEADTEEINSILGGNHE